MDPSVDTTPIAPALAAFFDDVLNDSVSQLNFRCVSQLTFRWGMRRGQLHLLGSTVRVGVQEEMRAHHAGSTAGHGSTPRQTCFAPCCIASLPASVLSCKLAHQRNPIHVSASFCILLSAGPLWTALAACSSNILSGEGQARGVAWAVTGDGRWTWAWFGIQVMDRRCRLATCPLAARGSVAYTQPPPS